MNVLEAAMDLRHGNILGLLSSGKQAIDSLAAIGECRSHLKMVKCQNFRNILDLAFVISGNEGQAQAITEETRRSRGDVVMFAGCKDSQTSADTNVAGYGATGACSFAFIDAVNRTGGDVTYIDLLSIMRDTLRSKYSQVVQMSTGFETDMNTPFIF